LNVIHNFLRERAFALASECYAANDSDIVRLGLVCVPREKSISATRAILGV